MSKFRDDIRHTRGKSPLGEFLRRFDEEVKAAAGDKEMLCEVVQEYVATMYAQFERRDFISG